MDNDNYSTSLIMLESANDERVREELRRMIDTF